MEMLLTILFWYSLGFVLCLLGFKFTNKHFKDEVAPMGFEDSLKASLLSWFGVLIILVMSAYWMIFSKSGVVMSAYWMIFSKSGVVMSAYWMILKKSGVVTRLKKWFEED